MKKENSIAMYSSPIGNRATTAGITLIALVVTIIILLILAGVTISLVIGQNGIITRANNAKEETRGASVEDLVQMWKLEKEMTNLSGTGTAKSRNEFLDDELGPNGTRKLMTADEVQEVKDTGKVTIGSKVIDFTVEEPIPDYEDLTIDERFQKMEEIAEQVKVFRVKNTVSGFPKAFNTIGASGLGQEAKCECGKVGEIFWEAEKRGLVKNYETVEEQGSITAPIREPSVAYYKLIVDNDKQVPGPLYPVEMAMNYEVRIANIEDIGGYWLDCSFPIKGPTYGDYETALMWIGQEFADVGFVIGRARVSKLPNYEINEIGQIYEAAFQVLTQTDFLKVAKDMNIDFTGYNCDHPTKY